MIDSISESDVWLFDVVGQFEVPICCLVSPDIEELFNRKLPLLERRSLAGLLWKHVQGGNLKVVTDLPIEIGSENQIFDLLVHLPIKERADSPYYGMTNKGRRLWKDFHETR